MKETRYTIGEIYRLGLLKNNKGEAYKSAAAVSVATRTLECRMEHTAYGLARMISKSEIERYNKQWKKR